MEELLGIREVVRRTGLSSRALRFYEAKGLVAPIRSGGGGRFYGPHALERINQTVTLKRAGLTLDQIRTLIDTSPPDLSRIIAAQLAALAVRKTETEEALRLLISVAARIRRGEAVDVATFCELIRRGETGTESAGWKREMALRIFGEQKIREGADRMAALLSKVDPIQYKRRWAELTRRIEAAMPLAPDSVEAEALYREARGLFEPLEAIGSKEPVAPPPAAASLSERLDGIDEWNAESQTPFSPKAFEFLFMMGRRAPGATGL